MSEENKEETYRLSLLGCLFTVLTDYGINISGITPKMGEHMVNDLMEIFEKQGYLRRDNET